jgi:hypothetical protein
LQIHGSAGEIIAPLIRIRWSIKAIVVTSPSRIEEGFDYLGGHRSGVVTLVLNERATDFSFSINLPSADDCFRRDTVVASKLARNAVHPTTGNTLRFFDFT